jgi:hypothetical protein
MKDMFVKITATGLGLTTGLSAIVYSVKNVNSYITRENAQYCANQTLTMLLDIQRQIQLYNATCILYEPGSNLSICNHTLLPKPHNSSCPDVVSAGVIDYLPTIFMVGGLITFGLFMGQSIVTSIERRNEQDNSEWYITKYTESSCLKYSTDESETLSEYL